MDEKVLPPPPVLAEVLVAHKYPHDGPLHEVGDTYELPLEHFDAFFGMGYVRRCEHPDNALPGETRPGRPHVDPHRGHADHELPGSGRLVHPDQGLPEAPKPKPKKG